MTWRRIYDRAWPILRASTHFTLKIICSWNDARNLSQFTNFPANMFLFGVRNNIALNLFLTPEDCILEALWKQMSVHFYISPSEYFCSKETIRFDLVIWWVAGGWIISLWWLAVWVSQNFLLFFMSHFVNFALPLPCVFHETSIGHYKMRKKKDFLHIWLLQRITLYLRR